jgi:hypothetical protein
LILTAFLLLSWRSVMLTFGIAAQDRTYDSPVGQFTLPTEDATAGTLGVDYQLASFLIGIPKTGPVVGDANGNTGNGFQDRYNYENINAFAIAQAGNNIGDLDSLDPNNSVPGPGGQPINPGFRFVHISDQPFIWRIGSATDNQKAAQVIVFPIIDHLFDPETPGYGPNRMSPPPGGLGNVVLEATEFTVWGTDDQNEALNAARTIGYFGEGGTGAAPNNLWVRGRLVKVLADGFKDYNGLSPFATRAEGSTPSPQEGEDFATMWEFRDAGGNLVPVKFVAAYANRTRDGRFFTPDANGNIPGNLAQSLDAEVDAVGFVPFVAPPPANASIAGRVINDANRNGAIDAGEAPIPGVTITLFDATGTNPLALTTTDASGGYSFVNLAADSYRVVETNLPNYIDTGVLPGTGNTAINLNTIAATLAGGQNSVENNFLDALPSNGGGPVKCDTICFRPPTQCQLFLNCLPSGTIIIGGVNFNKPISIRTNGQAIQRALNPCLFGTNCRLTPLQYLNQGYVAAQLSLAAHGGGTNSIIAINVLWGRLRCYPRLANFAPVTLSNGVTLTPGSMLKDLFMQAESAIRGNRTSDMLLLAQLFALLNADDCRNGC